MQKIYWVSRDELSPAQLRAIHDLHGEDAVVVKDPAVLSEWEGLSDYIQGHSDGFVYAVAGAVQCLAAAFCSFEFGIFENHAARRQDGSFGLAAVYHVFQERRVGRHRVMEGTLRKVWKNPDPMSDTGESIYGESLFPVAR